MKHKHAFDVSEIYNRFKLFCGTLVNIKAGSRKINRMQLRSTVAKIALWNDPL